MKEKRFEGESDRYTDKGNLCMTIAKAEGRKKEKGKLYLFTAVIATVFLAFCSRSSFFYPHNNWDDANSYFSMGKFMMNGGVIYRDLYDQKGPYLYLLYGIAYLISKDSFFGVFLLEIGVIFLFLLGGYRIFRLYCKEKTAITLIPVLAAACLSSKSFYWGGAAEEFCLPLFCWSLYFSLHYFKEVYPRPPRIGMIFLNGIFAGIIMQVKFNMLGFYFAWMAGIAIVNFTKENRKKALSACGVFLVAMLLTLFPWLIYFGIHGALDDWYTCYIYNNVFLYSDLGKASTGVGAKVYTLAKILYYLVLDNPSYFLPVLLGMVVLLLLPKTRWYEKLNLYAMFGLLFLGIFVGGANLPYYSIPLMVFSAAGLGYMGSLADRLWERKEGKRGFAAAWPWMIGVVSLWGAWKNSMNPPFMQQEKEDFFLFRFKEIVDRQEDATLLNYNCLDAGLYTVAGIVPTCKYFQTNGIPLKEMEREQLRYMQEGKTQFILIRGDYPELIWEHYGLAAEEENMVNGEGVKYYLFKRK